MKKDFFLIIIAIFPLLLISCGGHNKLAGAKSGAMKENRNLGDDKWQVEHRIPSCDSILVFIDNIVVPISSKLPLKERGFNRGTIQIYIPGESNDFYKTEKYKFYINPKCLEGVGSDKIFKIFCTEDSYQEFIDIDNEYRKTNSEWGLEISSTNGFGMGIKIVSGIVEKVYIGGTTIESK